MAENRSDRRGDGGPAATSSFVDALTEMKPNLEDWSRPAPTPFDDLVFFHTELLWHQTAGPMLFGVTKANNSVCVRITDHSNSVPETKQLTRGMTRLKIPLTKYTHLAEPECLSRCQLELTAKWSNIEPQPLEDPLPLRVLSFDLECLGCDNFIPYENFKLDNLQATLLPFIRNVFTLGTCSNIAGASVISYDDEAAILQRWSEFVQQVDPDLIIGYNISGMVSFISFCSTLTSNIIFGIPSASFNIRFDARPAFDLKLREIRRGALRTAQSLPR
ncbi:ribonuclease H-like domain-containing protein [Mycena metata]|uniref:DNA polymerase delta catalytic subunit n=1 Tax=Mycena metata TaxID=1033252 RepID=A0AAD7IBN4_9AGAR|nr:ribonuclease H-like domain-containing protein [Mycena metata]